MNKEEIQNKIDNLREELASLENQDNFREFDDFLDDCYPEVKILNLEYSTSQVLKAVDEIAYNCAFNDYNDEKITYLEEEIKELEEDLKEAEE